MQLSSLEKQIDKYKNHGIEAHNNQKPKISPNGDILL